MSKPIVTPFLKLLGACAPLVLAGCGESTNIQEGGGGAVTQCSSLSTSNVTCVTGRLVDDAASNVNYECGLSSAILVRSVTDDDGSFSCPSGSIAKFSLTNPDDPTARIALGEVQVVLPAQIYGSNSTQKVYFYVTPRQLAGDPASGGFSIKAINLTRFLQTLSDDTVDASLTGHLPSRRIIISNSDKRKITAAIASNINFGSAAAVDPANPGPGTFDEAIKPYLTSLDNPAKHVLISVTLAQNALQKGVYNTVAGFYQVPGGSVLSVQALPGNTNFTSADLGAMVGYDTSANKTFLSSMYLLVDRRGRTVGHGVYSFGTPSGGASAWLPWSDPQPMSLVATGYQTGTLATWPNSGDLSLLRFQMLGANDVGKYVRIDQGNMVREAVAGSSNVYAELFKESSIPSQLGSWSMGNLGGSVTNLSNGVYTLEHTLPVATLMLPDIWSNVTFPLPITLSIYNKDYTNTSCAGGRGCKMADIRMVILQDGNIITDRNHKCGQGVDPETLQIGNDATTQELPLGVVASAQTGIPDSSTTSIKAMVLLAMLPDDARMADTMQVVSGYGNYLPYLQFGSNLGASSSLLRVDSGANQYQTYGECVTSLVSQGLCTTSGYMAPKLGSWVNGYTTMRLLKAVADNQPASTIQELSINSEGHMEATRTDPAACN